MVYGVWLEMGYIRRFFVTAVSRATIQNKQALDARMGQGLSEDGGLMEAGGLFNSKFKYEKSGLEGDFTVYTKKISPN